LEEKEVKNLLYPTERFEAGFKKEKSGPFKDIVYPALDKYYYKLLINGEDRKSILGIAVFNKLKKKYRKMRKIYTEIYYSFDFAQSARTIVKMNNYSMCFQDELNELVGDGTRLFEKEFNNLIRSFNYTQKSFILCNVNYVYVKGLSLILQPFGFDEEYFRTEASKDMKTRALVRYIDDTLKDKRPVYLGYIWVKIGNALKEYNKYFKLKDKNYKILEISGGARTGKIDPDRFDKEVEILHSIAKKRGWKGDIKGQIAGYLQFTSISYDSNKKRMLIDYVWDKEESLKEDAEREKREAITEDELKAIAEEAINELGEGLLETNAKAYLSSWLQYKYPKRFYILEKKVKKIFNFAYFPLRSSQLKKKEKEREDSGPFIVEIPKRFSGCETFFEQYYKKNCPENKFIKEIAYCWVCGMNQRNISANLGIGLTTVNKIVQNHRTGENLKHYLLRFQYTYEYWIAKITGGERDGGIKKPDIFYNNSRNESIITGVGECKIYDEITKSKTLYLTLPRRKAECLDPSYQYCKENNLRYFPLFFRNTKWGNFDLCIPIDIEGSNKITIYKSDFKDFLLKKFDKNTFFSTIPAIVIN